MAGKTNVLSRLRKLGFSTNRENYYEGPRGKYWILSIDYSPCGIYAINPFRMHIIVYTGDDKPLRRDIQKIAEQKNATFGYVVDVRENRMWYRFGDMDIVTKGCRKPMIEFIPEEFTRDYFPGKREDIKLVR